MAPSGVPYVDYQELETQLMIEAGVLENTISGYEEALENKTVDYGLLVEENTVLKERYFEYRWTVDEYNLLSNNMTLLQEELDSLGVLYNELGENYLYSLQYELYWEWVFDMSFMETVTPRLDQVYDWLRVDRTDKMDYSEGFNCNQFAASLNLNAKQEDWDMGIIAVWGNDTLGERYAHVFNVLVTQEGLVYIEPQTDDVWWLEDYGEYQVNSTADINGDIVTIRDISILAEYN